MKKKFLEDEIEEYFSTPITVDLEIARYLPYLSIKQLKVVLELVKIFVTKNKGLRKKINREHQQHRKVCSPGNGGSHRPIG
jgi:hypothetical protein